MSTFPPPTVPPAGWYPDPTNGGAPFFDGYAWAPTQPAFDKREAHSTLPLMASLGALGDLMASWLVGRVLGAVVAEFFPDLIARLVAVVCGYAPSVMWALYAMRSWGDGRPAS